MDDDEPRRRAPTRLTRILSAPIALALIGHRALGAILGPVVRPVIATLAALRPFRRLGAAIARLPPYVLLALLIVPFAALEPLKLAALYWMAVGHPIEGGAALAALHLLSLLTVERLLHLGRPKLLTIGWFARIYGWLVALREAALAWLRATAAWRAGRAAVEVTIAFLRRLWSSG